MKGRTKTYGAAFLVVGIGLLACIPLGETSGNLESSFVMLCGIFSIFMGLWQLACCRRR